MRFLKLVASGMSLGMTALAIVRSSNPHLATTDPIFWVSLIALVVALAPLFKKLVDIS